MSARVSTGEVVVAAQCRVFQQKAASLVVTAPASLLGVRQELCLGGLFSLLLRSAAAVQQRRAAMLASFAFMVLALPCALATVALATWPCLRRFAMWQRMLHACVI